MKTTPVILCPAFHPHHAADYPGLVGKLVLAVTCAEPNPILTESNSAWADLVKRGDLTAFDPVRIPAPC